MSRNAIDTEAKYWVNSTESHDVTITIVQKRGDLIIGCRKVDKMIPDESHLRFEMEGGGSFVIHDNHASFAQRVAIHRCLGGE